MLRNFALVLVAAIVLPVLLAVTAGKVCQAADQPTQTVTVAACTGTFGSFYSPDADPAWCDSQVKAVIAKDPVQAARLVAKYCLDSEKYWAEPADLFGVIEKLRQSEKDKRKLLDTVEKQQRRSPDDVKICKECTRLQELVNVDGLSISYLLSQYERRLTAPPRELTEQEMRQTGAKK
ncbi:MAG: hypothetical protein WC227_02165 [Patescibacteria group bacterium]|jgi:hypothetical protein